LSEEKEQGGGFNKNLKKNYSQNTKKQMLALFTAFHKDTSYEQEGKQKMYLL